MKKTDNLDGEKKLTEQLIRAVNNLSAERKKMLMELILEWERLDYREDSRINCFLAVDYSTQDRFYQDFINNLSNGGVFIETASKLQVGSKVSLAFSLPALNNSFKIDGMIVRTDDDGIGVQFAKKLTPYQKELIHNAIKG